MILKQCSSGHTHIQDVGRSYEVVKSQQEGFNELFKRTLGEDKEYFKDVYAFLVYDGGQSVYPLYKSFHYYIFSEGGRLFDTLTFN